MQTRVLPISETPDWRDEALAVLRAGGVVAVPTETVYGLAGDARDPAAIAAIYKAKGRPSHNPLIAHVASPEMAQALGVFTDYADALASAFWPGALTMVVELQPHADLAPAVTAGGTSIALRCPKGPLADLVAAFGAPLAAPSANRSGHVSATAAQHVKDDLDGRIPLILDGGATQVGLESTIVDVRGQPRLLRPGAIDLAALEGAFGVTLQPPGADPQQPLAPGQLASHYAPHAPVRLNVQPQDLRAGEVYLGFGAHAVAGQPTLSASGDLHEAAEHLFDVLRTVDAKKPTSIAVAPIPNEGLGVALNDRLKRAAAPR